MSTTHSELGVLRRNAIIMVSVWTAVLCGSLAWALHNESQQALEMATATARANFNKDQAFRLWSAGHGGLYVRVSDKAQPNENLAHVPERDIVTPSGTKLTLMNPAEMLRQMMDEFADLYGIRGRIVALTPLRPQNLADEWEEKAIEAFESGAHEVFEITEQGGKSYLNLMRPMFTTQICLKCHGHQGYEVGDVHGGVGVSVPMAPYLASQTKAETTLAVSHGAIWLLGLVAIGFGYGRSHQRMIEREAVAHRLREAHDDLEIRVKERTRDLELEVSMRKETEKALRKAKDEAELATLAKSEFLANMSHELRTPLNAVIGFSDAMRGKIFGPLGNDKYLDYVDNIHDSGEHLLALINDILDVAKIEAGELELSEENIDVAKATEACFALVRPRAQKGGVELRNDLPERIPQLFADQRRFKQVLVNLLSNAVKFTPESGTVSVRAQAHEDGQLEISVIDTGIGMDETGIAKALEPFGQVDGSLSRTSEGTGLGLPLTKHLMEAHGGTMGITSKKGEGTAVTILFPTIRVGPTPMVAEKAS